MGLDVWILCTVKSTECATELRSCTVIDFDGFGSALRGNAERVIRDKVVSLPRKKKTHSCLSRSLKPNNTSKLINGCILHLKETSCLRIWQGEGTGIRYSDGRAYVCQKCKLRQTGGHKHVQHLGDRQTNKVRDEDHIDWQTLIIKYRYTWYTINQKNAVEISVSWLPKLQIYTVRGGKKIRADLEA